MNSFSKITYFYGLFIVISASFLRQFFNLLNQVFGKRNIEVFFYILCVIIILYLIFFAIKSKSNLKNFILLFLVIVIGIKLISTLEIFAEKTHILMYGLLGYFAISDTVKKMGLSINAIIYASCFTLAISLLDEGFQFILPYRVGDTLDVCTNCAGSILGMLTFYIISYKN